MDQKTMMWSDRKRNWCGLPWTFTKFGVDGKRLIVETGFFSTRETEVRLYRITNINLRRSLMQRIFGMGTIHIDSSDKDFRCYDIVNIKNPEQVKEMISNQIEEERQRNRVSSREIMNDYEEHDDLEDREEDDIDNDEPDDNDDNHDDDSNN